MSDNTRIKKARKNISAGFISRLISILIPFVSRTILLRIMEAEYLGLNSLFSSILSVLSLAELGIDSAITYNMYKPIAEGDTDTVCALLNLYKKLYRIIGIIIFGIGIGCMPFLDLMIKDKIPEGINISILFLMFLINSSVGYFLYAYKRSLLIALQRNDIASNISTFIIVLQNVLQIVLYYIFRNFYLYASILPICSILSNLLCNYIANRNYNKYQPRGDLDAGKKGEIRKQIGGLLVSKLTMQSRNSFDNIVISSFISLVAVTIYSNYFFVINSVHIVIVAILTSITSIVGNSIATETKEKNYENFKTINYLYMWISIWAMSCSYILYQDFMKAWAGQKLVLPHFSMFLFSVYGFILTVGDVKGLYSEANGLWWHNKYFTLIEALINISLNLVLGIILGINGIILASIISVVFSNFVYGPYTLFKHYFGMEYIWKYLLSLIVYMIYFLVNCFIAEWICSYSPLDGVVGWIIKGMITTVTAVLLMLVTSIKNANATEGKKLIYKLAGRRIR